MKSGNFEGSRMKKTGVLFPTISQFPVFESNIQIVVRTVIKKKKRNKICKVSYMMNEFESLLDGNSFKEDNKNLI